MNCKLSSNKQSRKLKMHNEVEVLVPIEMDMVVVEHVGTITHQLIDLVLVAIDLDLIIVELVHMVGQRIQEYQETIVKVVVSVEQYRLQIKIKPVYDHPLATWGQLVIGLEDQMKDQVVIKGNLLHLQVNYQLIISLHTWEIILLDQILELIEYRQVWEIIRELKIEYHLVHLELVFNANHQIQDPGITVHLQVLDQRAVYPT